MKPFLRVSLAASFLLLPIPSAGCRPPAAQQPPAAAERRQPLQPDTRAPEAAVPTPATAGSLPTADAGESLPTGRRCRVHLRRDALGLAAVAPLSVQQVSPGNRAASLEGTVEGATDRWVVLRAADRTYWLRVEAILAVEFLDGH